LGSAERDVENDVKNGRYFKGNPKNRAPTAGDKSNQGETTIVRGEKRKTKEEECTEVVYSGGGSVREKIHGP